MRRLDGLLGPTLCALLTVLRRATDPVRRGSGSPPARILIIKLAEQGATVVAVDAVRRAVELVGSDNVWILVFAENRAIVDELALLPEANVLTIDAAGPGSLIRSAADAVRRIRRLRIDSTVDLEDFSRVSAALAYLSGAERRVGLHPVHGAGPYRGDLLTHRVSPNAHLHAADRFRSLVDALSLDARSLPAMPADRATDRVLPFPHIDASATERLEVEGLVASSPATPSGRTVLLNPGGGDLLPLRRWPSERYADLGRRLLAADPALRIVVTGSAADAAEAALVAASIDPGRCVSVAGRTTMRQLLVLYEMSDVLVANDSGPAHYAALTDIEVVVLFGPETPTVFGPRSSRSTVLYAGVPCSPCINVFNGRRSACTDNLCMQAIAVDEVLSATMAALDRRPVPSQWHGEHNGRGERDGRRGG